MPNLSNIQEFANELKRLADEPEILRKRGETVEEPPVGPSPSDNVPEEPGMAGTGEPPMEEGLPPDIDELLAGLGEEGPETEAFLPEETPPEAASPEDFLQEEPLPEELAPDEGPTEAPLQAESPPQAEAPRPSEGDDFDFGDLGTPEEEVTSGDEELPSDAFFDDLLRESDQEEETEMTSIGEDVEEFPADLLAGEEGAAEQEPAGDEPIEEAPEQAGSDETADESIFFQVPSAEDLAPPEELQEEFGEPTEAPGEDFELPDFGEEPAGGEESELPETVEGGAGEEDFELPDFGEEPSEGEESELPETVEEAPEDEPFEPPQPLGEEPPTDDLGLPNETSFEELGEAGVESTAGDETGSEFEMPEELELPEDLDFEEPQAQEPSSEEPPVEEAATGEKFELPSFEEEIETESPEEAEFEISGEGFEEPTVAPEEEPVPEGPGEEQGGEAVSGDLDDLGLGDIGEEFGLSSGPDESEEELNPALAVGTPAPEIGPQAQADETALSLSDRDFQKIQETLSSLPRNLRIVIEELIGEQDLGGPQLSRLVELLVGGAPPREIADATSRIVGRKIQIPASYEKRTGLEFEEERATFAYRFRHNILPILRVFLVGAAVLALIVFLGYRFVYRPIHAYTLYAAGYTQLKDNNFVTANQDFGSASRVWEMKNWYYRYAEGYINKKQYSFAAQKYDALLKVWPGDRKGIFDYAAMESKTLGNYKKANDLLNEILNKNMWDRQGLLAAGDNYLAWGQEDPSKYELARKDYAMLLQHYGTSNEVLFRMLRYFIFTDNLKQVELLKNQFQADPKIKVNPLAYAELGGYLIDKNRLNDVHAILFRAKAVDPTLPEIHYNLARYFQKTGDYGQESVALQKALTYLQQSTPLTRRRLGMLIDTYDRIGENLYRKKSYLDAEQAYLKGINRYETALKQNQIKPSAEFGKLYANLGDLNYYISGNFNQALSLYQKAEKNGYKTPELRYREGYVYYRNQDYQNALLKLYNAAGNFSDNRNLLYATANTLFKRNDYFAAEGYYINLLNILEAQRRAITTFEPNVIPAHHDLLIDLMKVYNNLGVTLDELSKRSSDAQKYSQALVNLTHSMEAFDQLTRNPTTKQKSQAINLAFINMKNVLYPTPNYQLQIYSDLPQDMKAASF